MHIRGVSDPTCARQREVRVDNCHVHVEHSQNAGHPRITGGGRAVKAARFHPEASRNRCFRIVCATACVRPRNHFIQALESSARRHSRRLRRSMRNDGADAGSTEPEGGLGCRTLWLGEHHTTPSLIASRSAASTALGGAGCARAATTSKCTPETVSCKYNPAETGKIVVSDGRLERTPVARTIETTDIDRDGQQKATGITHEVWRLALDASLRWTPQCVGDGFAPVRPSVCGPFVEGASASETPMFPDAPGRCLGRWGTSLPPTCSSCPSSSPSWVAAAGEEDIAKDILFHILNQLESPATISQANSCW